MVFILINQQINMLLLACFHLSELIKMINSGVHFYSEIMDLKIFFTLCLVFTLVYREVVKMSSHSTELISHLPEEDGGVHHGQVALQADAALEDGAGNEHHAYKNLQHQLPHLWRQPQQEVCNQVG